MVNELIFFTVLLINMILTVAMFRFFGKIGLIVVIAYSSILCNILVLKQIELFGVVATLGNILYGGIFFATDILNERYGEKEARKSVIIGFICILVLIFFTQSALLYVPAESDIYHGVMSELFEAAPRIAVASFIAYLLSQMMDISLFQFIRRKTAGSKLWLRNNVSTMLSQILDTAIFTVIAFAGIFPTQVILEIFLTAIVIKGIVAVVDTPFFYFANTLQPPDLDQA